MTLSAPSPLPIFFGRLLLSLLLLSLPHPATTAIAATAIAMVARVHLDDMRSLPLRLDREGVLGSPLEPYVAPGLVQCLLRSAFEVLLDGHEAAAVVEAHHVARDRAEVHHVVDPAGRGIEARGGRG